MPAYSIHISDEPLPYAKNKYRVAHAAMPTSSITFTPMRLKHHGMKSMKPISDIWPSVILRCGAFHHQLIQEQVGERVIELQRDADEKRSEHEHGETIDREAASAHRRRGCPRTWRAVPPFGRRMRKREAEQPRGPVMPVAAIRIGTAVASSPSDPMMRP
jgi:hypothetical protein